MVVTDNRGISFSNQYIADNLGWQQETLHGMSLSDIFTKASNIFIDSYVYPLLIHELCAEELQLMMITSKGEKLPVVVNISLDKEQTSYWSIFSCASRDKLYQELIHTKELLEKQSEELLELATIDPLTGLLNRRELDNRANRMFSQAQRNKSSVAIMIIDVDFFKIINDTHGHTFGDEVLKHLGKKKNIFTNLCFHSCLSNIHVVGHSIHIQLMAIDFLEYGGEGEGESTTKPHTNSNNRLTHN